MDAGCLKAHRFLNIGRQFLDGADVIVDALGGCFPGNIDGLCQFGIAFVGDEVLVFREFGKFSRFL